jgi:hypothetical protein
VIPDSVIPAQAGIDKLCHRQDVIPDPVIPAQAGIQFRNLGSRLR